MKSLKKKSLHVTEDIMPLSEFKIQASRVMHSVRETGRSVIIIQNGKPAGVIIPPEEFDRMKEREDFIMAVEEGRKDSKAGNVIETKNLEEELDQQFGKLR